jgi:hypothetical protein
MRHGYVIFTVLNLILTTGCTTVTRSAVGLKSAERATIIVPKYLRSDYNSIFFNTFILKIDGESFHKTGKYAVSIGEHKIVVFCGIFAPKGSFQIDANRGEEYDVVMSTTGFGSMQSFEFCAFYEGKPWSGSYDGKSYKNGSFLENTYGFPEIPYFAEEPKK